ncbi:hypothetical protein E2C01_045044 [Portunus trituberculatus]|uniref:Uncharacterized protein n=1 Tax=Portunus trituberculatus TaxID=210409 RepID=A0A5B7G1S4_PORTR|nr:hypothetical protein [Portunus trituberculatus]
MDSILGKMDEIRPRLSVASDGASHRPTWHRDWLRFYLWHQTCPAGPQRNRQGRSQAGQEGAGNYPVTGITPGKPDGSSLRRRILPHANLKTLANRLKSFASIAHYLKGVKCVRKGSTPG